MVDMETGERMKLHPNEVKKAYTEAIQTYFAEVQLKCAQYAVDFMPIDLKDGLHDVLSKYLLKRQRLY